jgi:hypothetical protein
MVDLSGAEVQGRGGGQTWLLARHGVFVVVVVQAVSAADVGIQQSLGVCSRLVGRQGAGRGGGQTWSPIV